jgi:hypothetical protein
LEDRYHVAINDFQKAIIPDIGKVKANLVRLEEQLLMNKRFISEVLTVKKEFGKSIIIHLNFILWVLTTHLTLLCVEM